MSWSHKFNREARLRFEPHFSSLERFNDVEELIKEKKEKNASILEEVLKSLAATYKIDAKIFSYMVTAFVALIPFAGFVYALTYLGIFDIDATLFFTTEDYITFAIHMLYPFAYILPFYFFSYTVIRSRMLGLDIHNIDRYYSDAKHEKNKTIILFRGIFSLRSVLFSSLLLALVYACLLICYSIPAFISVPATPLSVPANILFIIVLGLALYHAFLKVKIIALINYNKVICFITLVVNIVAIFYLIELIKDLIPINLIDSPERAVIPDVLKIPIQYALILAFTPAVIFNSISKGPRKQIEAKQPDDTQAKNTQVNTDVVRETIIMVLVFVVSTILLHLTPYPMEKNDQSTFYFKDHIVMENGENGKEKSCNDESGEKCLVPLAASSNFQFFYCKNCESPHPKSYAVNRRSVLFAEKEGDKHDPLILFFHSIKDFVRATFTSLNSDKPVQKMINKNPLGSSTGVSTP